MRSCLGVGARAGKAGEADALDILASQDSSVEACCDALPPALGLSRCPTLFPASSLHRQSQRAQLRRISFASGIHDGDSILKVRKSGSNTQTSSDNPDAFVGVVISQGPAVRYLNELALFCYCSIH